MPKSRGNGEGSVYKENGKWAAEITLGYVIDNGKLKRLRKRKRGFETKKAALKFVDEVKNNRQQKRKTIQDLWEKYQATRFKTLSASKQTHYRTAYKRIKSLWLEDIAILGIDDLQAVIEPYSQSYYACRDIKDLLSQLYNIAIAEGIVNTNLTPFIVLPQKNETTREAFTEEEIAKLWKSYNDGDLFCGYILVMIYTGMMTGELLKVTRPMVNFDAHTIIGAGLKTDKRKEAPIILADCIIPVLEDLFEDHKESFMLCPYGTEKFYKAYYECLDRAGTRRLTPYSCRHTTATALASLNTNEFIIKEIMRHTKITTTQRYIHTDLQPMINAINKLG